MLEPVYHQRSASAHQPRCPEIAGVEQIPLTILIPERVGINGESEGLRRRLDTAPAGDRWWQRA